MNHAFAYGKAPMVINSVEKMLDTTIDFYVQINMEGLMEFVDAVGGIEVTSPLTLLMKDVLSLKEKRNFLMVKVPYVLHGCVTMIQKEIQVVKNVNVSLSRNLLKNDDFNSVTNFEQLMNAVSKNVKTDLPIGQVMALKNTYGPSYHRK